MHNKKIVVTFVSILVMIQVVRAADQENELVADLTKIGDGKSWSLYNATYDVVRLKDKHAVRLTAKGDSSQRIAGLALVNGSKFETGRIEIELQGKNVRQESFLGIVFNVADEKTFEGVYFRPFNFRADPPFKTRAVQYISWPENTWETLRRTKPGRFENAINPVLDPDGWFHARIDVRPKQVSVYVNHAPEACLTVTRLATGQTDRPVGLFVDVAEGLYADLRIITMRTNEGTQKQDTQPDRN